MSQTPIHTASMYRNEPKRRTRTVSGLLGLLLLLLAVGGMRASAQAVTLTNAGPLTLKSGAFGSVNVVVTPGNSFTGAVQLICTNMASVPYAYCIFPNLNSLVQLNGSAVTVSLTVNTSQVNDYEAKNAVKRSASGVALCMLLPAGFALFFARKRRMRGLGAMRLMASVLVLGAVAGLSSCANTTPKTTPPGTYTIPITGTYSNGLVATTNLSLIVT